MKKKRIIISSIIGVLLVVATICAVCFLGNKPSSDALKFKESYESLNNTVRESDGANYNNVSISKNNPIKYLNALEAVDVIKNKTGVIYFGANWCPWCRNAVPVLLEAAKKEKLEPVYYVDMDTIRNVWAIKDNKLVKTTIEGEGYYELLEALDSILGDSTYTLKDSSGKIYDTKEKRIYMPLIITVNNGRILDKKVGTVNLSEEQTKYDKLTNEQHDELLETYRTMIKNMRNDVCSLDGCE